MDTDWNAIWDRKGADDSNDPYDVSGFEAFHGWDTAYGADFIIKLMEIKPEDKVLEVGVGAGLIGRHIHTKCNYVACDRSPAMVAKTIAMNGFSTVCCDADDLIFKDKTFDKVFAFGVFHYFPDHEYARRAIAEMTRVARQSICVVDVPEASHDKDHLLYSDAFFDGWVIRESIYEREHRRFSALKRV